VHGWKLKEKKAVAKVTPFNDNLQSHWRRCNGKSPSHSAVTVLEPRF